MSTVPVILSPPQLSASLFSRTKDMRERCEAREEIREQRIREEEKRSVVTRRKETKYRS